MKAIAVMPGKKHSALVVDARRPGVGNVPDGRGVLVKVLRVGVDGTDREIKEAMYGRAPEGEAYLILGHENFGRVEAVGPNVTELAPGDYVVSTVRRPGRRPAARACAKLRHASDVPCIFCGQAMAPPATPRAA